MDDSLPLIFLASCGMVFWRFFDPQGMGYQVQLAEFALPLVAVVVVLIMFHVLIALVLPLRWPAIRGEFGRLLDDRLQSDLEKAYATIPAEVATTLVEERKQVEQLIGQVREVAGWLEQRQQAASIGGMYGK